MSNELNPEILQKLSRLKNDLPLFARTCLKVVNAEGNLVPFVFNESQRRLHAALEAQLEKTGMSRMVILKGRKQGVSTYISARYLHKAIFNSTKQVFILTHHSSTTSSLFQIVENFYKYLPDQLQLKLLKDNDKQLIFENGSQYTVATAGAGEIGRGATPQFLHSSEMASYEHNTDQLQTGIFKAVAAVPGTEIAVESTAKGVGNMFHQYCMSALEGEGRYELHFLPWYIHETNYAEPPENFVLTSTELMMQSKYNLTPGQLYWRRLEMVELRKTKGTGDPEWMFKQEFPCTIQEAFQLSGAKFFDAKAIDNARHSTIEDIRQPIILGVDPARDGDRTTIVRRQGRKITYKAYTKMDEMQLAGILGRELNKGDVAQVFIDVAHGYGTIDRLRELGFGRLVTGIHFGASKTVLEPEFYHNKRAEMYGNLKSWLEGEEEVNIPDDDDFIIDLLSIPEAKITSSGKLLMQPKKEIKAITGKSPDITDGAVLTFAFPVKNRNTEVETGVNARYTGNTNKNNSSTKSLRSPIMDAFGKNDGYNEPPTRTSFNFNNRPKG